MNTARVRKILGLLLAGAWLPATITCDPGVWRGVGCCGGRDYSFDFDFEYDD